MQLPIIISNYNLGNIFLESRQCIGWFSWKRTILSNHSHRPRKMLHWFKGIKSSLLQRSNFWITLPMPTNFLQATYNSKYHPHAKTSPLATSFQWSFLSFKASSSSEDLASTNQLSSIYHPLEPHPHAKISPLPTSFFQDAYHSEHHSQVRTSPRPSNFHQICLSFRISFPTKDFTSASLA